MAFPWVEMSPSFDSLQHFVSLSLTFPVRGQANRRLASHKPFLVPWALGITALLLASVLMSAQTINVGPINVATQPSPGSGHDYIHMLNETVNPANGSVSVRVEAPVPQQRGDVNFPYYIFGYDSSGVSLPTGNLYWAGANGAASPNFIISWTDSSTTLTGGTPETGLIPGGFIANATVGGTSLQSVSLYTVLSSNPTYTATCNFDTGFIYVDPEGTRHGLNLQWVTENGTGNSTDAGCGGYSGINTNTYATGGDQQYQAALTGQQNSAFYSEYLADAHGRGQGTEDTNGNCCGAKGQTTIVNKQITSVTIPGISNPYKYTYGTQSRSYAPGYTAVDGTSCGKLPGESAQKTVLKTITLPNSQLYQFSYDPTYALLNKITYPTGAWVSYTWAINSRSESLGLGPSVAHCDYRHDWPYIQKRIVSFNGTTQALEQDFAYTTTWGTGSLANQWTQKTTTVTTKDLVRPGQPSFQTVYTYSALPLSDFLTNMYEGQTAVENSIVYKDWNGSTLKTVTKNWKLTLPPLLASECTTVPTGITSGVFYTYGSLGVVTDKKEYDYGILSSSACAQGASAPTATPTRETVISYQTFPATPLYPTASMLNRPSSIKIYGNGALQAETDYTYDAYGTSGITGVTAAGHDDTAFPASYTNRGNVTTKTVKCFVGATACTNAVSTYKYYDTGQVASATDPCGNATCSDMTASNHTTAYSYTDAYTVLSGGSNVPYTPSTNTNNYLTTLTDPLGHNTKFTYDFGSGQLTSSTDQNSQTTDYLYNDSLGRITQASFPDGGETTYVYHDATPVSVTEDKVIYTGFNLEHVSVFDGLGHLTQTQLTSDSLGTDFTDTAYDGLGQQFTVSNAYRTTSDATYGVSTYQYDALGRITQVAPPDGTAPTTEGSCLAGNECTSYSGNTVTVTDQAGIQRKSQIDGLGRLTAVWENPGGLKYETDYQYDALDNLICAVQKATDTTQLTTCSSASATWRPRSFTYDSLSRLVSAGNPESGTIAYSYDSNGNVTQKKAPLPNQTGTSQVTTNYVYDALNRLTQKNYTGMTQAVVRFGYDGVAPSGCAPTQLSGSTNLIGRRSSMCDGAGSASWSYDQMGRTIEEQRAINGITKKISYFYELDGELNGITYPDGKQIAFDPYGNGLPIQITDSDATFQTAHYYTASGAEAQFYAGPPSSADALYQTFYYNKRFQPAVMYATDSSNKYIASYCYDFHVGGGATLGDINVECTFSNTSPGDNGNLYQVKNNLDGNRTQNFSYDALSRIQQAYTSGPNWGETYTIDAWGNLTNRALVSGKTTYEPLNAAPATTANRLTGYSYDAAGNLTNDGAGHAFTYDAENRLATAGGVTYTYDGDGKRVMKSNGTIYWMGLGVQALAESNLSGTMTEEYVFLNGRRIVRMDRPSGTVHLYFNDLVGSATLITDINGNPQKQSDYYPYGGEIVVSGSDTNHYKFTGKERDAESGVDNFGARYYSSPMGRFMTPDPLFATPLHLVNPQRWNMYAYVVNNPTNYIDPDGKDAIAVNFVNEVPGGGHEGIIVVHADGSATYARFGPQHEASPADKGKVTVQALSPVQFQGNGLPTDASYKALSEEVAKIEGQPASTVGFNYFKTSEADSIALDNWMQEWKTHQAPDYNVTNQNCATFCIAGLIQGRAIQNKDISIIPNRLFMLLAGRATENWTWQGRTPKEKVTHKICWTDDKKQQCQ